jgi:hypothetical protein
MDKLEKFEAFLETPEGQLAVIVIAIWTLIWKGPALWKSAKQGQMVWFIALLILNTVGILPIIYLIIEKVKSSKDQTDMEDEVDSVQMNDASDFPTVEDN